MAQAKDVACLRISHSIESKSKESKMLKRYRWFLLVINVTYQLEIWTWRKLKMLPNHTAFPLSRHQPKQEWVSMTHSTLLSEKLEKIRSDEDKILNHVQDQTAMDAVQLDVCFFNNCLQSVCFHNCLMECNWPYINVITDMIYHLWD